MKMQALFKILEIWETSPKMIKNFNILKKQKEFWNFKEEIVKRIMGIFFKVGRHASSNVINMEEI